MSIKKTLQSEAWTKWRTGGAHHEPKEHLDSTYHPNRGYHSILTALYHVRCHAVG